MEPTIKDKYIILGFIGVAICLISFFIYTDCLRKFQSGQFCKADSLCMQQYSRLAVLSLFPDGHFRLIRDLETQVRQEKGICRNHKGSGRTATGCK